MMTTVRDLKNMRPLAALEDGRRGESSNRPRFDANSVAEGGGQGKPKKSEGSLHMAEVLELGHDDSEKTSVPIIMMNFSFRRQSSPKAIGEVGKPKSTSYGNDESDDDLVQLLVQRCLEKENLKTYANTCLGKKQATTMKLDHPRLRIFLPYKDSVSECLYTIVVAPARAETGGGKRKYPTRTRRRSQIHPRRN
ncbi:hypothetical protein BDZ89DRAFT_1040114 [Hymenopellis radicata]|nr:hypothetical protein BDZ89DRAFT_1040114 [Hymenopellis radicata]